MPVKREWMLLALLLTAPMTAAAGNVITDWDEKAISLVQTGTVPPPPTANRALAILHIAMFDAVNSIEPRYKPYKIRLPATPDTSKEAAAAAAAGAVLVSLVPDAAETVQSSLTSYLATLPDGEAKSKGISWRRARRMARRLRTPIGRGHSPASISQPPSRSAGRSGR